MERRLFLASAGLLVGGGAAASLWNHGRRQRAASSWAGRIALGQTYDGTQQDQALIAAVQRRFFDRVNDRGGVHGRKVEVAALDDRGDGAVAVGNIQSLAARPDVLATFGTARVPLEVDAGLPQLFVRDRFEPVVASDGVSHIVGFYPSHASEGAMLARNGLANAKSGGTVRLTGDGSAGAREWIAGIRRSVPTGIQFRETGPADFCFAAGSPAFLASIDRVGIGRLIVPGEAASAFYSEPETVRAKLKGSKSVRYLLDANDPEWTNAGKQLFRFQEFTRWNDDTGAQHLHEFAKDYMPDLSIKSEAVEFGYCTAKLMLEVLLRAGEDLTRRGMAGQALRVADDRPHLASPGLRFYTSAERPAVLSQGQPIEFDGSAWQAKGKLIAAG